MDKDKDKEFFFDYRKPPSPDIYVRDKMFLYYVNNICPILGPHINKPCC